MERRVGDVLTFNGTKLKVVQGTCRECYFKDFVHQGFICTINLCSVVGECSSCFRKDEKHICFKKEK